MMAKRIVAEQNHDGTYHIQIFEPYLAEETPLGLKIWKDAITTIPRGEIHINAIVNAIADNSNTEEEIFIFEIPMCED